MSRHELDGELHVARAAQRLDALLISASLAVKDVELISSALTKRFSSGFTNIKCPRWFCR